jgi:predicted permease
VRSARPLLLLLQAGAVLLLAIGGVNLVNLLLIRASGRARELAIRQSLGASWGHIVRQVMAETVLLTLAGGLFGLAVGAGGIRLVAILGARQLPLGAQLVFGGPEASAALLGAVVLGVIISIPIIWFNLYGHPAEALQSESRGATLGLPVQHLRHGFIIAQIALAFVLLAGAGLLGLSLKRAMEVSPGFRQDHLLTGQVSLPFKSYPDWPSRVAFMDRLLREVRRQPGVVAAGVINHVPFSGEDNKSGITLQGQVRRPGEPVRGHYFYGVGGDAFAALGIPLREGRLLDGADSDRRVCVVDEPLAKLYWPNGGAIGRRFWVGGSAGNEAEAFTIVGVVGAIKQADLTEDQGQGAFYASYQFRTVPNVFALVRTSQPPEAFGLALQQIVRTLDPELPVNDVRSMELRITDSLMARRAPALLTGIFASLALLLASIGTYGVLAFAVSRRQREIGVRLALGALPQQIGAQFLRQGLRLLASGLLLGWLGAWLAGRAMQGLLFQVPALSITTLAATSGLLAAVSLLACWLPAHRAARVDPNVALRND